MRVCKKIITLIFVASLLLSLDSCVKAPEGCSDWVAAKTLQYGALSDTGYYYLTKGSFLHYVDFYSGTNVCLCSRVGCKHDDSSECEAFISGLSTTTPLFYWGKHLYYVLDDQYGSHVYRRSETGTDMTKVSTLCQTYMREYDNIVINVYYFTITEGYLYYTAEVSRLVQDETGLTYDSILEAIIRLNLSTGKENVVAEDLVTDRQLNLIAVKNNSALYSLVSYPENPNAENYSELSAQCPVQLLQWDAESNVSSVLLERTQDQFGTAHSYFDGKLYYTLNDGKYSYDLETGESALVAEGSMQLINQDYALWRDPQSGEYLLKDLSTGELLPNEPGTIYIRAISDDVAIFWRKVFQNNRGKHANEYAFVTIDSLVDGLQMDDFIVFYIFPLDN